MQQVVGIGGGPGMGVVTILGSASAGTVVGELGLFVDIPVALRLALKNRSVLLLPALRLEKNEGQGEVIEGMSLKN